MSNYNDLKIGAIIISNKILLDAQDPGWMYRVDPINESDSGWRVFSGTEDDEYLGVSSNFRLISAEKLIAIDDEIKVNLLAPIGSSFERVDKTNKWIPVDMR